MTEGGCDGNLTLSKSGSSFNAWGEATPLQNRLIDTITRSKMHIICTMRTKTEYVIEPNAYGKSAPRKVGTAPIQRADVEYEFDVYGDMDIDNTLIVHKSRCSALAGAVIAKPDAQVAETLKRWLAGEPAPEKPQPEIVEIAPIEAEQDSPDVPTAQQLKSIQNLQKLLGLEVLTSTEGLSHAECAQLLKEYSQQWNAKRQQKAS